MGRPVISRLVMPTLILAVAAALAYGITWLMYGALDRYVPWPASISAVILFLLLTAGLGYYLLFSPLGTFIARRLMQSVLTILGVMVLTFLLFRLVAGDVAAANLGEKATESKKAVWRHRHGYDLPTLINYHNQLLVEDRVGGAQQFFVQDAPGSRAADALALILSDTPGASAAALPIGRRTMNLYMGRHIPWLSEKTGVAELTAGKPVTARARPRPPAEAAHGPTTATVPAHAATAPATAQAAAATATAPAEGEQPAPPPAPAIKFTLSDGSTLLVDLTGFGASLGIRTAGDLVRHINEAPGNGGRVHAWISPWRLSQVVQSQFFHHLRTSATFEARSLKDNRKLTDIIAERGPASLALQLPAFAMEWLLALVIACFLAYYRDSLLDRLGVFLTVLGMCIPFLAFMIYGQWLMFEVAPRHAFGTFYRANMYLPITIMIVAAIGSQVRFYRTVLLDETNRDYVRTARAKGLPLTTVLFKHVLKNCMLPILTSLVTSIPFLILGGLLVESFFGVPGLGDLMLTSIQDRNEPIMNALVFLTALVYTLGILVTDICYAIFDPRIRLR